MPRFSFDDYTILAVLLWFLLIGSIFVLMWWNKKHAASTKRMYIVGVTFFSVWAALISIPATVWFYNDMHREEEHPAGLAQIISSYGLDPYATYPISASHQDNVSHVELNANFYGASTLSAGSDNTADAIRKLSATWWVNNQEPLPIEFYADNTKITIVPDGTPETFQFGDLSAVTGYADFEGTYGPCMLRIHDLLIGRCDRTFTPTGVVRSASLDATDNGLWYVMTMSYLGSAQLNVHRNTSDWIRGIKPLVSQ